MNMMAPMPSPNPSRSKAHKPRPRAVVSYTMSRVRSSGSEIERLLGSAMFSLGLRYRKQYGITGRPDFAFPRWKVAVFCDSNFWHGKDWETLKGTIKTNRDFWLPKIERNIARDAEVNRILGEEGWTVIRFWEDEIKKDPVACAEWVKAIIASKNEPKGVLRRLGASVSDRS